MALSTRPLRLAVTLWAVCAALIATPLTASAHVNRLVGPYTFFIVLIEEPFFATNRAGFEFWVHEGDRPVQGLDRTLKAQAINASRRVDLVVSPANVRGFYDVESDSSGGPFDPGSGGNWTLRLIGTVEGLAVDESFATIFPAYPRGSAATPTPLMRQSAQGVEVPLFVAAGVSLMAGGGLAGLALRQRRRRTLSLRPIGLTSRIE
jgi:hypothetical protein